MFFIQSVCFVFLTAYSLNIDDTHNQCYPMQLTKVSLLLINFHSFTEVELIIQSEYKEGCQETYSSTLVDLSWFPGRNPQILDYSVGTMLHKLIKRPVTF